MKSKFRVTLNRKRYRVVKDSLEKEKLDGVVDFDLSKITIDNSFSKRSREAQAEVLLHEALHVIAPGWKEEKVLGAGRDLARMLATAGVLN